MKYLHKLSCKIVNLRINAIKQDYNINSKVRKELSQADELLFKITYNKYDQKTVKNYLNQINGIIYNSKKIIKGLHEL